MARTSTDIHPSNRNVAMVFQNCALFSHLSVFDYMAFGLQLHGVSKQDVRKRVERAATLLHLEKLLDRKPKQLSGGQHQPVAIRRIGYDRYPAGTCGVAGWTRVHGC
jgi:ABC-type sugar transport system ATPase subunit